MNMKDKELSHIKMMNGDDILAFTRDLGSHTELHAPIMVQVDPHLGLFAKSWLLLSEANSVSIRKEHIIFASKASKRAVEYYEEFMHRIHERVEIKKMEEDSEFTAELEDIFTALVESKTAIKN
jgi:hypothetical protein